MDTISTYFPRLILQTLDLVEEELSRFLSICHLTRDDVFKKADIQIDTFNNFLSQALVLSKDPALGLKFGRYAQSYLTGEYASVGLNAPNLQSSLLGLINFSALQASYIQFDARTSLLGMTIQAHVKSELGETARTQHEVVVLTLQNYIELIINKPFSNGRFQFAFSEPPYAAQYNEVFNSHVEFNTPVTSVFIPQELLMTASPFYDEQLWQRGKLVCAQKMQELNNRQQQVYSYYVLNRLKSRIPPLAKAAAVAAELNVSERTLHRRLSEEGQNYRTLYNQAMTEWAKIYLLESCMSIETVAGELGYQDAASFRRSFKRLMGISPQQYRDKKG